MSSSPREPRARGSSYPSIPAPSSRARSLGVPHPSELANGLEPARNVRRPAKSAGSIPPPVSGDVAPEVSSSKPARDSRVLGVLRAIVGVLMVIGIGSGVVWGARHYVRTSPRFAVSEIVTSGGKRRGPDDIASIAAISKGQNVFSIDLDAARRRLSADPWIEGAELTRQLPGRSRFASPSVRRPASSRWRRGLTSSRATAS